MTPRYFKLRFNLDKPRDREAWEILKSVPGSMNAYILDAICARAKQLSKEAEFEAFKQMIIGVIRSELSGNNLSNAPMPVATETVDDTVLDNFLENAF